MFNYIIEFKNKNIESTVQCEAIVQAKWNTYQINENCKLYISPPKSKGQIYIFKNIILWGKLFKKENHSSSPVIADTTIELTPNILLKEYWGSYIALFFDEQRAQILRDPSASQECLWFNDKNRRLVFSDVNALYKNTINRFNINLEYVAANLYLGRLNNNKSALKNVFNLKPGYILDIESCRIKQIWSPIQFVHSIEKNPDIKNLELRLKETIIDCIKAWADTYDSVLLNLSGGLDSCVVALCIKLFSKTTLNALNISFDSVAGDEVKFAKELCDKFDIPLSIFKLTNSKIKLRDKFKIFPPQHRPLKYGLGFECLEEEELLLKEKNIQAIFSGCGGDALFQSRNSSFISQDYFKEKGFKGLFNVSRRVAELTDRTVWDLYLNSILSKYLKGRKYLYEGSINKNLIHKKYSNIIDNDTVSHPWHEQIQNLNNGKKFQISGLVDTENFYTYRKTSEYVDIIHPLLSQPIIELCLSIPSYILTPNLINRGLLRSSFKSFLPESIILRRSKGKIGNYYDELIKFNYEDICTELQNGNLIDSEILSKEWLKHNLVKGKSDQDIRMQLFQLLTMESWFKNLMCEYNYEKNT